MFLTTELHLEPGAPATKIYFNYFSILIVRAMGANAVRSSSA
jgi:hypothetical protein